MDLHVIREELTNNIREVLMATMIPILQDVCVSLFQQLNENFRTGLDQYMKQIHTLCTSALRTNQAVTDPLIVNNSSSADPSALINLIENQRITAAFEKVSLIFRPKKWYLCFEVILILLYVTCLKQLNKQKSKNLIS